MTQEETDALLARAKGRDRAAVESFGAQLRNWLLYVLVERFSHVSDGHAQMLDEAERTFLRWLVDKPDKLRPGQSLHTLAWRLLAQSSKTWTRQQKKDRKARADLRRAAKAQRDLAVDLLPDETKAEARLAIEAILALPKPHWTILVAHLDHDQGRGPPLAEKLGVSGDQARLKLFRARAALLDAMKPRRRNMVNQEERLTHDEQAMAHYGGDLSPQEQAEYEPHLAACAECQERLGVAKRLLPAAVLLLGVRPLHTPAEQLAFYDQLAATAGSRAKARTRARAGAALAVVALLAAGGFELRRLQSPPPPFPPPPAVKAPPMPWHPDVMSAPHASPSPPQPP